MTLEEVKKQIRTAMHLAKEMQTVLEQAEKKLSEEGKDD